MTAAAQYARWKATSARITARADFNERSPYIMLLLKLNSFASHQANHFRKIVEKGEA